MDQAQIPKLRSLSEAPRLSASLKEEVVLVGQNIESFGECESRFLELGGDLLLGELHRWWRPDGQLFLIEIDHHYSSALFQRLRELGIVSGAVVDVVQYVTEENRIDLGLGKARVVRRGQNGLEVWRSVVARYFQQFFINVHRIYFAGVLKIDKQTHLVLSGYDKQMVGQVAANIRALRKPDPYKNKGVRYTGERLRKKVGKTGASAK